MVSTVKTRKVFARAYTNTQIRGIHIEATGQSIVTVGDGNQVNARFSDIAESTAELEQGIRQADSLSENQKIDCIGDIDSMQSQSAKSDPNAGVLRSLWNGVKETATIAGLASCEMCNT